MNIRMPLPLYHSWPLFEAAERMALPALHPFALTPGATPASVAAIDGALTARGIGLWECHLADNRLSWSQGVYDLFGLERGEPVERALTLSLYKEPSRAVMKQLRAHAIRHRRGFTVDAELRAADGVDRWMRLSAMPVIEGGKVVRLRGLKIDVTAEYDAPRR